MRSTKSLIIIALAITIMVVVKTYAVDVYDLDDCYKCDVVYTGWRCPVCKLEDKISSLEDTISSLERELSHHTTFTH